MSLSSGDRAPLDHEAGSPTDHPDAAGLSSPAARDQPVVVRPFRVRAAAVALLEVTLVVAFCVLIPVVPAALMTAIERAGEKAELAVSDEAGPAEVDGAGRRQEDDVAGLSRPALILALLVQSALFVVVAVRLRDRHGLGQLASSRAGLSIRYQAAVGALAGGAALGGSIVLSLVLMSLGIEPEEQGWIVGLARGGDGVPVVLLLLMVVAVPLGEELLFRGYVFERLRRSAGLVVAYLISTALFAVVHGNPSAMVLYLYLGLVMAWAYHHTEGALAPVLAHGINNAAAFVLLLAAGRTGEL